MAGPVCGNGEALPCILLPDALNVEMLSWVCDRAEELHHLCVVRVVKRLFT